MSIYNFLVADDKSVAMFKDETLDASAMAFYVGGKVFGVVELSSVSVEEKGSIFVGPFVHVSAFTDALSLFLTSMSVIESDLRLVAVTVPRSELPSVPPLPSYRSVNDPFMPPKFASGVIVAAQEGIDIGEEPMTAALTYERFYEGERRDTRPVEFYRRDNAVSFGSADTVGSEGIRVSTSQSARKFVYGVNVRAGDFSAVAGEGVGSGSGNGAPSERQVIDAQGDDVKLDQASVVKPPVVEASVVKQPASGRPTGDKAEEPINYYRPIIPEVTADQIKEAKQKIINSPRIIVKPMVTAYSGPEKNTNFKESVNISRGDNAGNSSKPLIDWSKLPARIYEKNITELDSLLLVEYNGKTI